MTNKTQLDIRIESTDSSVIQSVEAALQPLKPAKREPHRDLITILTVTASTVSLAKTLIELWKGLKSLRDAPPVKVEAESGAQLSLTTAKSEDEIQKYVTQSSA
jgi:hypothetical protein